jgi:membrane-associated protease RseP (regulator of RpoE activity)
MRQTGLVWGIAAGALLVASGHASAGGSEERAPVAVAEPGEPVAYLGVQLEEETDHPEGGARVTEVVEDSPAEKAGLEAGDVVIEFDGVTIRGPVGLTRQIHAKSPGARVTIRVLREGRERRLEAQLGERGERSLSHAYTLAPLGRLQEIGPEIGDDVRERVERGLKQLELPRVWGLGKCAEGEDCGFRLLWSGRPRLGVELVETTPELNRHLGSTDEAGVLVGKVLRGMPAEHAGIRVGDLIVRVGDVNVTRVSELRSALARRSGETFTIRVIRDKKAMDIEVTLPEVEDELILGPQASLPGSGPAPPAAPVAPDAVDEPAPSGRPAGARPVAPPAPVPPSARIPPRPSRAEAAPSGSRGHVPTPPAPPAAPSTPAPPAPPAAAPAPPPRAHVVRPVAFR